MTQSKKVQFQIRKQDVTIELSDRRKGVYWSYPDTLLTAGPFKSEATAIEDAKLYSQYGTTSKQLLKTAQTPILIWAKSVCLTRR